MSHLVCLRLLLLALGGCQVWAADLETPELEARCWEEFLEDEGLLRGLPLVFPSSFDEADALVERCEDLRFAAWFLGPEIPMFCAPRNCSARVVRELLLPRLRPADAEASAQQMGIKWLPQELAPLRIAAHYRLRFVIAGYSHSGTTTLHRALTDHPQVGMASADAWDGGELHEFFWYSSYKTSDFKKAFGDFRSDKIVGVRATWTALEGRVMQRMAKIPGLKIIVVMRDPLSQLDSMLSQGFGFFSPFGQTSGLAAVHPATNFAKNVLPYWRQEDILPVPFKALKTDPQGTLERVFRFLGVNSTSDPQTPQDKAERRMGGGHWLHKRKPRLPLPRGLYRQSVCDIPPDWQPTPDVESPWPDFNLPLRRLLRGRFAPERRLADAFLADYGWPDSRLDEHSCIDDSSLGEMTHEYVHGAHDYCAAAKVLATHGHIPGHCVEGDRCQRCCVFLQARCPDFWQCCGKVQDALRAATLPALQEALCNSRGGGCCLNLGGFQSP